MKKGWRVKALGELCRIELGSTPARGHAAFWDEKKQTKNIWLSIADLPQALHAVANDSKEYVSDTAVKNMRKVPAGTLLVSFKLTLGRLAYAGIELCTNEAIASLLDLNTKEISKEYLYWALTAFDWNKAAEGDEKVKGKTLNKAKLKLLPIPLPPLDEQRKIVAILDEAFEGIDRARANVEANLASANDIFDSELHAVFADDSIEWSEHALSDLGSTVTGSTPKTSEQDNLGSFIPFIKPGDFLSDGSLEYGNFGLSEKGAAVSRVLPSGCALMVCIGATIGKCGHSDRPIATNQQINALVPRQGISGEYIYLQMLTRNFQKSVLHGAGQATLPIINKGKWSSLRVRLPKDLKHQMSIVEKMNSIRSQLDELREKYLLNLSSISDLRQSLLQKAFAGELT